MRPIGHRFFVVFRRLLVDDVLVEVPMVEVIDDVLVGVAPPGLPALPTGNTR